jgi:hypothetical protein
MKPAPESEITTSRGESLEALRLRARRWAGWELWIVEQETENESRPLDTESQDSKESTEAW